MSSMSGYAGPNGSSLGQGNNIPKGYKTGRIQNFTPQQMQLFKQMFQQVSPDSETGRLAAGDEGLFDEMEQPALRQFGALQGNLASRFSGMGMGSRNSSGFQNTTNQAASDFAQELQSKRQGLQRQAIQDLMGMSNSLLTQQPYENFMVEKAPKKKSGWGGIAGSALGGAGGFLAGGPAGALTGAKLGYDVGNAF